MSDDFLIDMTEINTLAVSLESAAGTVGARASQVVRKTAHDIEAQGKQFAPVDTGNLRNSIGSTVTGDGRFGIIEAEIGPTANYGAYVEFGTSRHGPAAYMGPALDRHTPGFVAALEQLGGDVL